MTSRFLSHIRWLLVKYKIIAKAALINIPFRPRGRSSHRTGGTVSARYCYSVWLRHLVIAHDHGLQKIPQVVAELGPGDSLGIGLAALISGARQYYALDVVHHANDERNVAIFDELVELFKNRTPIPDQKEFPRVKPFLTSYAFPSRILTDDHLRRVLDPERLRVMRQVVGGGEQKNNDAIGIRYFVPWYGKEIIQSESVDLIYSQAVLEYVDDLDETCGILRRWLKPGGFMSHQIDFKSHDITPPWNGHWSFSEEEWKILRGRRPYFLNREPYSTHVAVLENNGFKIVYAQPLTNASELDDPQKLPKEFLAPRFRNCSEEDMLVSGALIQTVKI